MKATCVQRLVVFTMPALLAIGVQADVVTDWNQKAGEITVAHQGGPWGQVHFQPIEASVLPSTFLLLRAMRFHQPPEVTASTSARTAE
jgi:hypothetical protein